jgi:aspartate 1-decarboxylase
MLERTFLRALIVGGTATAGDRKGVPSITVDANLMDAADLDRLERVEVSPVNGGWSMTSFLLRGRRGDGEIRIDGPGAARVNHGERVFIAAWSQADRSELATLRARIVAVEEGNRIGEVIELGLVDAEELGARR